MKQYISITSTPRYGIQAYGFDKLDGSNIRAEWEKKKGLWKFGSRRRLLGSDQDYISDAESLIREKYEEGLNQILEKQCINNRRGTPPMPSMWGKVNSHRRAYQGSKSTIFS